MLFIVILFGVLLMLIIWMVNVCVRDRVGLLLFVVVMFIVYCVLFLKLSICVVIRVLFCIINGCELLRIENENVWIWVLILFGLVILRSVIRVLFCWFFWILLFESIILVGFLLRFWIRIINVCLIVRLFVLW